MRRKSGLALALVLAVAASTIACKDKENPPPAPVPSAASVTPQASAPVASASGSASADSWDASAEGGHGRHDRGPHARGLASMFFRAAQDLTDLKDDQKPKIEEAQKKAHDTGADTRDEMKKAGKELHAEINAGVKAGKIEAAKLEPKYAALEKLQKAQHEKEDEGLNALHAALTAPQRKAVVESVKKKSAEMEERMAKRAEHAKDKGEGKPEDRAKKHVERLTADLGLDADQQKKVDAIAAPPAQGPDRAELKKRTDAILAAFDKDTFDAKKVDAFDAKKARAPMEAETKLVSQILAILKPEQREKLAAKMDKGPSPHGRRGGGGGGDRDHGDDGDDD